MQFLLIAYSLINLWVGRSYNGLSFTFSGAFNERRGFELHDDLYAEYAEKLLTELHKQPDDDLQKFLDDKEDRNLEMEINEYYEW